MNSYPYKEAKKTIQSICKTAGAGGYATRDSFFAAVNAHPSIAVQGYNAQGTVHYWNKAATALYGYTESEAINRNLFELILPSEFQLLARDMIAVANKTGRMPESGTCDLMRMDKTLVTVYSGHVMFYWETAPAPEFFCLDLALEDEEKTA